MLWLGMRVSSMLWLGIRVLEGIEYVVGVSVCYGWV